MNIAQIENNLQQLVKSLNKDSFIYDLLLAYGLPKASITRLQKGNLNLSKVEGELSWKKKVLFNEVFNEDLHIAVTELATQVKHDQRFVIVTDYKLLLAIDTKTNDKLDIDILELPKHYDFFLPWAGMEKAQHANENPADVKAAERMAKLFDEIKKDNPDDSPEFAHGLNVFLSRLLFCFFAEDTNIFKDGQFTNAINSHTQKDGSDLNEYLDKLFDVLNTSDKERKDLPTFLADFPYVNGGLFRNKFATPKFTRRSRQIIIDSGELNWSAINPDIFGSMIQAVVSPEHRGGLGMHYTSVPNIMKVIEPLFLNDLYEAYDKASGNQKKLNELLNRIRSIKIFDPACGSGNFLIIAYKELRILEMKILKELSVIPFSGIVLSQFYGIEIDDFAHEIAQLSLWLAEHQMNVEFFNEFGRTNPTLPLKENANIVQGNACRLDWEEVCVKNNDDETYILGNPPYLGYARQNIYQKKDMAFVFRTIKEYKKLDYITCWFYKGTGYIKGTGSKFAFVTTNSITQGEQVDLLWPLIFNANIEIGFAHQSFKWKNNAKSNAGVSIVIIGLQNKDKLEKRIYLENKYITVQSINPYLSVGNTIVKSRSTNLSNLPIMIKGCSPGDGGNLLLSSSEKDELLSKAPSSGKFLKEYIGAKEFMYNDLRYCIWVDEQSKEEAYAIEEFAVRFNKVKEFRLASKKEATRKKANFPYLFDERKYKKSNSIIIPQTGSERRDYIPIGFLNPNFVVSNAARIIYDAEPWCFGIISSKMHIVWIKAISGRLKMDMQYSNTLCYNTFPFPPISTQRKNEITQTVFRILEEREKHSDSTLAQLYDPDKMPEGLREAHHQNDMIIEKCYRSTSFTSDEERLEYLFKLYEKMIEEEKEQGTLFAKEKPVKKKKH